MLWSVYISFTSYNLAKPDMGMPFVGFSNYVSAILSDSYFIQSFSITFYIVLIAVTLEMLIGLGVALFLNRGFKGESVVRGALLVPMMIPPVIVGLLWRFLLSPDISVLNFFLSLVGIQNINWIGSKLAPLSIVIVDIWQWTPLVMIILYAGLQAIPLDLLEVADVEGASQWQKFRLVVFPLLKKNMLAALVLRTVGAFKIYDTVVTVTRGGPGTTTEVMSLYVMRRFLQFHYAGYGAATSYLFGLSVIAVSILYIRILVRR